MTVICMRCIVKQFVGGRRKCLTGYCFLAAYLAFPPLQPRIVRNLGVKFASSNLGVAGAEICETRDWGHAHRADSRNLSTSLLVQKDIGSLISVHVSPFIVTRCLLSDSEKREIRVCVE